MHVILNVDAISAPLTGIGRYALELATRLPAAPEIESVRYFAGYRWVETPTDAQRANRPLAALRRSLPLPRLALELYFRLRQRAFARGARRASGSLLHSPNYLLFDHDGPTVATVHDLSWRHYPGFHPRERVAALERHVPGTLRTASRIITDSEFVRSELVESFGIEPGRVRAVPLGVSEEFRPREHVACAPILAAYGLVPGRYLLAVGTLEPRKNLARLVRAYRSLPPPLRRRFPLVVVGSSGWRNEDFERSAAPLEREGTLRRLGYVDERELPVVYAGARAFAFVSLYEGFGLPPLEAMASGIPIVISRASALTEVEAGAGLSVDAESEQAIAAALERALEDEDWRARASVAGQIRAKAYSWRSCVEGTVSVYREAELAWRAS